MSDQASPLLDLPPWQRQFAAHLLDGGCVSVLAAGGRKGGRRSLSRLIVNAELAAGKHVHLAGLDGLWCGTATDIGPLWEKIER